MRVRVTTETGCVECIHVEIIEVPDNISEDELEELAKETALNKIDWCYEKIEEGEE